MTFPTTAAEVLLRAADLIDQRGHHQGDYVNRRGCLCVRAAILVAVDIHPAANGGGLVRRMAGYTTERHTLAIRAEELLEGHLARTGFAAGGHGLFPIVAWSDTVGRTKAEIVAGMRAAAEAAS